jgi:hypothetical protein
MTFGGGTPADGAPVVGALTATLVQKFGTAAEGGGGATECDLSGNDEVNLAGCTETDTFSGEVYADLPASTTSGAVTLGTDSDDESSSPTVVTTRTGCADPSANVSSETSSGPYSDGITAMGATFVIDGATLTGAIGPLSGTYVFTKTSH